MHNDPDELKHLNITFFPLFIKTGFIQRNKTTTITINKKARELKFL